MKKLTRKMSNVVLFLLLALAVVVITLRGASAYDIDDSLFYYSLDNVDLTGSNPDDVSGNGNDGVNTGATVGVTGVINQAFDLDGSADKIESPSVAGTGDISCRVMVNFDVVSGRQTLCAKIGDSGLNLRMELNTGNVYVQYNGASYNNFDTSWSPVAGNWYELVAVISSGHIYFYVNGGLEDDHAYADTPSTTSSIVSFGSYTGLNFFNGKMDEIGFYNFSLSAPQVASLAGVNPYGSVNETNFSITASNLWDGSLIQYFNASIDGHVYSTDSYNLVTNITDGGVYDVLLFSDGYVNRTYSGYNSSDDLDAELFESVVNVSAVEKITGDAVLDWTLHTDAGSFVTSNGSLIITPNIGYVVFNWTNAGGYVNQTSIGFNVSSQFMNDTLTVFNDVLNVTVYNAYTGVGVVNFSGWVYNGDYGFNESFNASGLSAFVNLTQGLNYTVFVDHPSYAINESTNYKNVSVNDTYQDLSFGLYTNNSIRIYVYDEATSLMITDNVHIVLTSVYEELDYNTSNGTLFVDNLLDGEYTVKLYGDNYSLRTYVVTVADRSTQRLNAYLSASSQTVIFTVLDFDNGATVEGAGISMSRLINSTWTIIGNKFSDITGRAQFTYTPNVKYRFMVSKAGYNNKIFDLDPVIFSEYNVKMSKVTTITVEQDYSGLGINFYPTLFYDGEINTFIFTIQSPAGTLQSYGVRLDYPGGSNASNGTNSQGETFTLTMNITGADFLDKVNLTYYYDTTISDERTFFYQYSIVGVDAIEGTLVNLKDYDFGFGILERMLIGTLIILLLAGFTTMFLGAIPGAGVGFLVMGVITYIGFFPLWASLISFLVLTVFIIKGAGD